MEMMDPGRMTHESAQVAAIRRTAAGRAERQARALMCEQVALGVYQAWAAQWPPDDPDRRQLDDLLAQLRATWSRRHRAWCRTCALAYARVDDWPALPVLTAAEVEAICVQLCMDPGAFDPERW